MTVDFKAVAADALRQADVLVPRWLPSGQPRGHEWIAANPKRPTSDGSGAFSVNLHTGKWADFACGDKGGDLVSLYAYLHDCTQIEAAKALTDDRTSTPAPAPRVQRSATMEPDGELLSPAPAEAPPFTFLTHRVWGPATRHWIYRDAAGAVLLVVVRWDAEGDKQIRQFTCWRRSDGRLEWRMKWCASPRPLYGLDRLAARPDAGVMVCEGEKACDAAGELLPAWCCITSPGGAENARKADWSPLKGRRVAIWQDADEAGAKYAATVAELATRAGAASVELVDLGWVAQVRDAAMGAAY